MANVDVARILRLKGAVQATANQEASGGKALSDMYDALRDEVRAAIPSGLHEEYDRLFPRLEQGPLGPYDLLENAQAGSAAETKLIALAGWLDGTIEGDRTTR